MRTVVLAGGIGGSKFLWGLAQEMEPERLTAVVNTGDDIELHGLSRYGHKYDDVLSVAVSANSWHAEIPRRASACHERAHFPLR